jgi:hypothetical protein
VLVQEGRHALHHDLPELVKLLALKPFNAFLQSPNPVFMLRTSAPQRLCDEYHNDCQKGHDHDEKEADSTPHEFGSVRKQLQVIRLEYDHSPPSHDAVPPGYLSAARASR